MSFYFVLFSNFLVITEYFNKKLVVFSELFKFASDSHACATGNVSTTFLEHVIEVTVRSCTRRTLGDDNEMNSREGRNSRSSLRGRVSRSAFSSHLLPQGSFTLGDHQGFFLGPVCVRTTYITQRTDLMVRPTSRLDDI